MSFEFISHISSLACNAIYSNVKLIYINLKNYKVYDLNASGVLDSIMYKLVLILKRNNINSKVIN